MNAQMNVSYRNDGRKDPDFWYRAVIGVIIAYFVIRVVLKVVFNIG